MSNVEHSPNFNLEAHMTRYGLAAGLLLVASAAWCEEKREPKPADIETATLQALEEAKFDKLTALMADVQKLTPTARRELTVRIYGDVVEFHFRGRFPGKDFQPEMFEYVIAAPGKEYETFLVVDDKEFARLGRLGTALQNLAKTQKVPPLEIKFVWEEGGDVRVEDLRDVLGLESAKTRDEFISGLGFNKAGLGQTKNVRADPARLPTKAVPARVIVAVRLPKPVPEK